MIIKRFVLLAAISMVALFASARPLLASTPLPPPTTPNTSPATTPATTATGQSQMTESWALTPATSADPDAAGNRSEFTYAADPGTTITDAVTVFNLGNVSEDFHVYGTDAFNNEQGQFNLLSGDQQPTDVGAWVTVAQERITVPPGKQATVPITIKVPLDASPGDHAGAILASSPTSGSNPAGDTVQLDRRTGSRVYIRISGPLRADLAVTKVDTTYDRSVSPLGGTAHVSYRIDNRGNVRLGGTVSVSVAGPFGLGEKKVTLPAIAELLPGQHAVLSTDLHGVPELMYAAATVRLQPAAGRGVDIKTSESRNTSFVPPIPLLLALLVLLLVLLALRVVRRRRADSGAAMVEHDSEQPQLERQRA